MPSAPRQRFEEILQSLWDHLKDANAHLSIWEELRSTPDREKLWNTFPGFFVPTRNAHLAQFINKICVATDKDERDKSQPSIYKLANMVNSHPSLAPGVNKRDVLGRMERHDQVQTELRSISDRRSSHWDLSRQVPEPSVSDCRQLSNELHGLLEDIWNAYEPASSNGRNFYPLTPLEYSHTSYVLDKLTEAVLPSVGA